MGLRPWHTDIPDASSDITCHGESHRISWRAGCLVLDAHHDPEAERAMQALGGDACECLVVWDLWVHQDPRRSIDRLPRYLDQAMQDRWVLGRIASTPNAFHPAQLTDLLQQRAGPAAEEAARKATGHSQSRAVVHAGTPAAVHGETTTMLVRQSLVLEPAWLYRVWATGNALRDGRFIVDLADDATTATVVEWQAQPGGWHAVLAEATLTDSVRS